MVGLVESSERVQQQEAALTCTRAPVILQAYRDKSCNELVQLHGFLQRDSKPLPVRQSSTVHIWINHDSCYSESKKVAYMWKPDDSLDRSGHCSHAI